MIYTMILIIGATSICVALVFWLIMSIEKTYLKKQLQLTLETFKKLVNEADRNLKNVPGQSN